MGAWGMGSFENDDALDLVADLMRNKGPEAVVERLRKVAEMPETQSVDVGDAAQAIAAAEVVAAGRGKACDGFPSDAGRWLGTHTMAAASLRDLALKAVKRVLQRSDLVDAWSDAHPSDAKAWRDGVDDLIARLG